MIRDLHEVSNGPAAATPTIASRIRRGRAAVAKAGARTRSLLGRLCREEDGGEVIEYVFIALLIIVACISVIAAFGTKVLARWSSVNSSM